LRMPLYSPVRAPGVQSAYPHHRPPSCAHGRPPSPGNQVVHPTIRISLMQSQAFLIRRAGFFLPAGFPDSVANDYLPYQLWAVPCHITGWMTSSLATSSLLQARPRRRRRPGGGRAACGPPSERSCAGCPPPACCRRAPGRRWRLVGAVRGRPRARPCTGRDNGGNILALQAHAAPAAQIGATLVVYVTHLHTCCP